MSAARICVVVVTTWLGADAMLLGCWMAAVRHGGRRSRRASWRPALDVTLDAPRLRQPARR